MEGVEFNVPRSDVSDACELLARTLGPVVRVVSVVGGAGT